MENKCNGNSSFYHTFFCCYYPKIMMFSGKFDCFGVGVCQTTNHNFVGNVR